MKTNEKNYAATPERINAFSDSVFVFVLVNLTYLLLIQETMYHKNAKVDSQT